jgi:signal transduction histidine kinase
MESLKNALKSLALPTYTKRQWISGTILFFLYLGIMLISDFELKNPILSFPSAGIALSILFLEGTSLWPFVFLASFIGELVAGFPIAFLLLVPGGQALQAATGSSLLHLFKIDPLFRRSRDIFILFSVVILVSTIAPLFASIAFGIAAANGSSFTLPAWGYRYASTVFSLLILTPFLLRWIAKPRFSRNWIEAIETVAAFAVLLAIDSAIFLGHTQTLAGVPLVYLLLVPFFWIALRLRPRFVTLAMVITSILALAGTLLSATLAVSPLFGTQLFQTEIFLISIASMFYIIMSLEENRRLNSNLLSNQLATLENAVTRISSESDAKNDFIAVLAHELRNPLAPIVSGIDLLKLRKDLDADESETLTMMEDRMHTVKRLLDDLLDISRITEGKIRINHERVNLEKVIRQAIVSTAHHIRERHQLFSFKDPSDSFVIEGDAVRLEQIFSNLITNASKYSDSGDQITLSLSEEKGFAKISVRDTGIGIAEDSLKHIFLPFHQVELGARTRKGLGIGLALVRNFVELHGGTVDVKSKGVGQGSTFTVLLPLAK